MELDYLREVCGMSVNEALLSPFDAETIEHSPALARAQDWLVFFTEPYGIGGWRSDEVYKSLLPALAALARRCGLELIIKLHPFESMRRFKLLTKQLLSFEERARMQIVSNVLSSEQWARTRLAIAVESSVAIECTRRGIPIFLLGWLRNRSYGYLRQFQKFQIGQVVESPAGIAGIADRLIDLEREASAPGRSGSTEASEISSGPAPLDSRVAAS
jgi:hypothetical protein